MDETDKDQWGFGKIVDQMKGATTSILTKSKKHWKKINTSTSALIGILAIESRSKKVKSIT